MQNKFIKAYTDYPLLKKEQGKIAPIREVELIGYDGDKYCYVVFNKKRYEIKGGYIYKQPGRSGGNQQSFSHRELEELLNAK